MKQTIYIQTDIDDGTITARHFKEKNDDPFYLKPVEMPSEEEIHIIAQRIANKDGGGLWGDYYRAAKAGAKAITKLMKGEKL